MKNLSEKEEELERKKMVMEDGWRWDEVEKEMVERGEIYGRKRKIKWKGKVLRENGAKMRRKSGRNGGLVMVGFRERKRE